MLRFAPIPNKDMNIADLSIATINYIIAQQKNDKLLIRIVDINKESIIEGKDTEIMMILEKFAIKHNIVYHQSEHINIYRNLAINLLKENRAYICKCNQKICSCENLSYQDYKELKNGNEKFKIRIKAPKENNFIILDENQNPTYEFASACDDMLSSINLVIDKEKYKEIQSKLEFTKKALNYNEPTKYIYLTSIENGEEITILSLLKEGIIPNAILNYIILLYNPNAPKEIFNLSEAIEWFDIDSIPQNSIKFDIDKLKLLNREHLLAIDDKELSRVFGFADSDIGKLAKVYLKDATTINELEGKIRAVFSPKDFDNQWGENMRIIQNLIEQAPAFESLDELTEYISQKSGLKDENLFKPLQILLTGSIDSNHRLDEIYPLIKSYILEVIS